MAIANADGSIVLTTQVDQSGLKSGMSTMKGGASSLTGAFGKLASVIGVAFSVGVLVKFGKEASSLATKTEASVQRLIDIYGEASKAVGDFIDANANALGMSRSAAASYASVYGNLFSVWADQKTNAELTNRYLQMTAVVASKTGRTVEDVQERIRSGLLGNTEAIEDLGVFVNVKTIEMTDAFQRMANGKSWEQLDAYSQQQIRTFAILEQATQKYGNEVAETSALTKSQFRAAWQDFQATWGQVVNKVLIPALEILTDILVASTAVMQSIFNISSTTISHSDAISSAVENQEKLTDEVKETGKAAKKAFASFDTLEVLTSGASGGSSQNNTIFPDITVETQNAKREMSEFEKTFTSVLSEIGALFEPLMKIDFTRIQKSLNSILKPIKKLVGVSWGILSDAIEKIFNPLAEFAIEDALPRFFESLASAVDLLAFNLENRWQTFIQFLDEFLTPIWEYAEPKILAVWDNLNTKLNDFVKIVEESEAWEDFKTIMSEIYTIVEPLVEVIISFLEPIINFTMNQEFNLLSLAFKELEDALGVISALIKGDFDDTWEHLKGLLGDNLFKTAKKGFEDFKETVADVFDAEEWKNFGVACINGLISGFEGGINGIIWAFESMINWIVDGLNKISFDVPDWVPVIGGKTFGFNIPEVKFGRVSIPRLAQGTVVPPNKEFMAVLGDNTKEHEIVSPVSIMKQAFMEAMIEMGGNFGGGNTEVVLEIDGREFGRAVVEQGNRENRRIGTKLVIV